MYHKISCCGPFESKHPERSQNCFFFNPALSHHQPRIRSTFYIACIGRKQIITNKNILIEVGAGSFINSCTAGQRTFKYSVCIHKVSSCNQSQNNYLPITRKAAILSHLRHVLSHIEKM